MNSQAIVNKIEEWLVTQADTDIQETLVDLMIMSMREPLIASLPAGFNLNMIPEEMREQFFNQIKAQVLISLKSLINANKENSKINELIVKKHFKEEERESAKASVEKYSQFYTEEVENFYHKINKSDFQEIMLN